MRIHNYQLWIAYQNLSAGSHPSYHYTCRKLFIQRYNGVSTRVSDDCTITIAHWPPSNTLTLLSSATKWRHSRSSIPSPSVPLFVIFNTLLMSLVVPISNNLKSMTISPWYTKPSSKSACLFSKIVYCRVLKSLSVASISTLACTIYHKPLANLWFENPSSEHTFLLKRILVGGVIVEQR